MPDVKISALPASTTPLAGTEVLPIVQSSTTKQVSVANLTAGRSVGGTNFIPSGSSVPTNGLYLPAANSLGFSTNSTEQVRISSAGLVGIGTSSPSAALSVIVSPMVNQLLIGASTADSGYGSISFNGTSGATRIGFTAGGTGDPNLYYDAATAGIHQFRVNNAIKMVVDSNGNVLVGITTARANAGDVQVSKGISFPATQSAQSDANTLDDYEEGTWTGTYSSAVNITGTPTFASGRYTKIGNLVNITGIISATITLPNITTYVIFTGNPFVPGVGTVGTGFGNQNQRCGTTQIFNNDIYVFFPAPSQVVAGADQFYFNCTFTT